MKYIITESQFKILLEQDVKNIDTYPSCVHRFGDPKVSASGKEWSIIGTDTAHDGYRFYNTGKVWKPKFKTMHSYVCKGRDILIDGIDEAKQNWDKIKGNYTTDWEKRELEKISNLNKNIDTRIAPVAEYLVELRRKYPNTFDFIVSFGLWFLPGAGPFLSISYGTTVASKKIHDSLHLPTDKKGNIMWDKVQIRDKNLFVTGLVEFITGPVSLGLTLRAMKKLGHTGNTYKMLTSIQKSGVAVLVSEGWEGFLKWGTSNFKQEFEFFIKLLNDRKILKEILSVSK